MKRGHDAPIMTTRVHAWPVGERTDSLAIEAPLELRILGQSSMILMRTPGHDHELAQGFMHNEGLIHSLADIVAISRPVLPDDPEHENVLAVELRTSSKISLDRSSMSNSSCGACGKRTLAAIRIQAPINRSAVQVSRATITALPDRLRAAQTLFAQTGGVHASGLFTSSGELLAVREDVGRHNALDKLIGWALQQSLIPLDQHILMLSGRISFELVQKAVVAGIPIIAAVGAPSSLAVELAAQYGVTLMGFVREASMNVYTHAERVRNAE